MTIHTSLTGPMPDAQRGSYVISSRRPKMTDNAVDHDEYGPLPSSPPTRCGICGSGDHDLATGHPSLADGPTPAERARHASLGNTDDGYDAARDARIGGDLSSYRKHR